MSDPLRQELLEIFVGRATRRYGLSEINQLQHALQSAALAEADGAPPATVLAALLHDVGHMIHDLGEDPASRGVDDVHEALGADWLAERFGPEVSEPVRLHVTAKRYLCTVEADYFGKLGLLLIVDESEATGHGTGGCSIARQRLSSRRAAIAVPGRVPLSCPGRCHRRSVSGRETPDPRSWGASLRRRGIG